MGCNTCSDSCLVFSLECFCKYTGLNIKSYESVTPQILDTNMFIWCLIGEECMIELCDKSSELHEKLVGNELFKALYFKVLRRSYLYDKGDGKESEHGVVTIGRDNYLNNFENVDTASIDRRIRRLDKDIDQLSKHFSEWWCKHDCKCKKTKEINNPNKVVKVGGCNNKPCGCESDCGCNTRTKHDPCEIDGSNWAIL